MKITKDLLIHWWHYYGRSPYTLEELEIFLKLIDEKGPDKIFDIATASVITHDGSPTFLHMAIIANRVDDMFMAFEEDCRSRTEEQEKVFQQIKKQLYDIINDSYKKVYVDQ